MQRNELILHNVSDACRDYFDEYQLKDSLNKITMMMTVISMTMMMMMMMMSG